MIDINENFMGKSDPYDFLSRTLRSKLPRGFSSVGMGSGPSYNFYEILYNTVGLKTRHGVSYASIRFAYFYQKEGIAFAHNSVDRLLYKVEIKCKSEEHMKAVYKELDETVERFCNIYSGSLLADNIYTSGGFEADPAIFGSGNWLTIVNTPQLHLYIKQVHQIINYLEGKRRKGRM